MEFKEYYELKEAGIADTLSNVGSAIKNALAPDKERRIHTLFTKLLGELNEAIEGTIKTNWRPHPDSLNAEAKHLRRIYDTVNNAFHDLYGSGEVDQYGYEGNKPIKWDDKNYAQPRGVQPPNQS